MMYKAEVSDFIREGLVWVLVFVPTKQRSYISQLKTKLTDETGVIKCGSWLNEKK